MNLKFDLEFHSKFKNSIYIDYGVVNGNNIVVFIKAGQDGSCYGYNNKYLKMAKRLNEKYGCTVITSSNPFDGDNPMDNAMEIINNVCKEFEDFKVYFLGFSNGGIIGIKFATTYSKIKKIISVNAPLMLNFHKLKQGILNFNEEKIYMIYGDKDSSFKYIPLLDTIDNPKLKINIIKNEDHYISKNSEDFYCIPEKYFFEE